LQAQIERVKIIAMDQIIREVQEAIVERKTLPEFSAGDTISVDYKIKEGNKERIQQFRGVVIQRRGTAATETFTVRKVSSGMGVERIFPVNSPFIENITIHKVGSVRRARIFYLRDLKGKAARIKEKRR
jgi:large subunit ribosomal protein L19